MSPLTPALVDGAEQNGRFQRGTRAIGLGTVPDRLRPLSPPPPGVNRLKPRVPPRPSGRLSSENSIRQNGIRRQPISVGNTWCSRVFSLCDDLKYRRRAPAAGARRFAEHVSLSIITFSIDSFDFISLFFSCTRVPPVYVNFIDLFSVPREKIKTIMFVRKTNK